MSAVNRRLKRAFECEENIEVPDIPDCGQLIFWIHIEELGSRLLQTGVETPDSEDIIQLTSSSLEDTLIIQENYNGSRDCASLSNVEAA